MLATRIIILILCLFMSLGFSSNTFAYDCTYYVNNITGDNNNLGTTESAAWKTLSRVTAPAVNFNAGEVICFHRDQLFYQKFNGSIISSGTPGNPIVFTSYGPGLNPARLTNAKAIESHSTWVDLNDGRFLYEGYTGSIIDGFWEGGIPQNKASNNLLAAGDGTVFLEPGVGVYFRPQSGDIGSNEIRMANSSVIFGISNLSYLTFDDLQFEYSGTTLYGTAGQSDIHHITIQNCLFDRMATPVLLVSTAPAATPKTFHDITVIDNQFDSIRNGIKFDLNKKADRYMYNVNISNNTVRNVSIDGAYAINATSPDIEVFSFQNLRDSIIANNDVRDGIKLSDGIVNKANIPLASVGVEIWVQEGQTIERVSIERNRFHNLEKAIGIGSGTSPKMHDNQITHNLITGCGYGIRVNSADPNNNSRIYNNVLKGNDTSFSIFSNGSGYQFKNNISVSPTNYHFDIAQFTGMNGTSFDHNLYVPSVNNHYQYANSTYTTLQQWQDATTHGDQSVESADAGFVSTNPIEPSDFNLAPNSPAIDRGANLGILQDFSGNSILGLPDIGAFEFGHNDTDADGLIDYDEVCFDGNCQIYNPYNPIDNLSGTDTDINNADSDNDGFTDGTEFSLGANPLDSEDTPTIVADGDINSDGQVNAVDVLLATRHVLGLLNLTLEQIARGDLSPATGDGAIDVGDLLLIQKTALSNP